MQLIRDVLLPPDTHFSIYLEDSLASKVSLLGLHNGIISGVVTQIYQRLSNGFHSIFNNDHHLFALVYKENEHVLVKAIDKVNFYMEHHKPIYSNRKPFDNFHFLTNNDVFIFLRNIYWGDKQLSVELSQHLLLKLRRLSSSGFGEGHLSSLFSNSFPSITDGIYSLYTEDYYVYVIFELRDGKILIHELLKTEFFTSGLKTIQS